jgi:O-antigen ligase/tetratricopeptide (TPR) repeat protein
VAADSGTDRFLSSAVSLGVHGGLLMAVVVLPGVYQTHTLSKMVFLQVLVDLTFPAFVVLAWKDPLLRPRLTAPLAGLAAWVAVLGVATVFAPDVLQGFWGVTSRMTGMFSLLHVLAWGLMAAGWLRTTTQWRQVLRLQLWLGVANGVVGLLQVPFPTLGLLGSVSDGRVMGLMGNPIFFSTHLVFTLFLAWWFTVNGELRRAGPMIMIACGLGMIASGSRGPLLGLVLGGAATLLMVAYRRGQRARVAWGVVALLVLGTSYVALATWVAASPSFAEFGADHPTLARLGVLGDARRQSYWAVMWEAFKTRPWLGWGNENLDIAYTRSYRPLGPCTPFFEDRPHNVVLEVLVSAGVLGLVAWAAWWWAMLRGAWRGGTAAPWLLGVMVAHLAGGMVAFDTPTSWMALVLLTVLLHSRAMAAFPRRETATQRGAPRGLFPLLQAAGLWLAVSCSVQPLFGSWLMMNANTALTEGNVPGMVARYEVAARQVRPYREDWLQAVSLQVIVMVSGSGGQPRVFQVARMLLEQARPVAQDVLARAGGNTRVGPTWARMLATLGEASQDAQLLDEAGTLLRALALENPRRQDTLMDHADWLAMMGRTQEAADLYQQALRLDPDNAQVNWRAGFFTWMGLQDAPGGARLLVRSTECPCAQALTTAQQTQLAQARLVLSKRVDPLPR